MDITINLLELQGFETSFIKETEKKYYISVSSMCAPQKCPCCGKTTSYIHGYRKQEIKDIPFNFKNIVLVLKKRRYICKECGKTFFEKYPFLSKYARATTRFYRYLFAKFTTNITNKAIAEELSCSPTTVARIIRPIQIAKPKELPKYLGIDEFKGNTDGEKYQLILTDLEKNKIFDILPSRKKEYIKEYLKGFKNRNEVEYFVMDMTGNYKDISWLFPNAKVIVDKFHYVRQIYWALDNVRKRIQKQFIKEKRIYFKHSKKLLYKDYDKLNNEQRQQLYNMLYQSEELRQAWLLKEHFRDFKRSRTTEQAEKELRIWLLEAEEYGIQEFKAATTAFHNWAREILNSITYNITNARTEGYNNKIKVLNGMHTDTETLRISAGEYF